MGCDITCVLEKFNDALSKWELYSSFKDNNRFINLSSVIKHRNYNLFAILADCRNKEDAFCPIEEPRGIPLDCDPIIQKYFPQIGGHHQSYFTVQEILDYPLWDEIVPEINETARQAAGDEFWELIQNMQELWPTNKARLVFTFQC